MDVPVGIRQSERTVDRLAASRDLWPRTTLEAWQGGGGRSLPDRVWWPETAEQVLAVLSLASHEGTAVTPYGAGSGVCGGAAGQPGAWVVDLKGMSAIGPLDRDRWVVEVEAGVNGQQLEDWLDARGFTLGHSPSSISCSTVGGWAAARSAGQFSSRYGVFEDMVLAIEGVAPGRGVFRVGEGGDAPDSWLPLLLGSEGTLCVITRLWLRVWPKPETRWLRAYRFDGVAPALDSMRRLMQAELWPSVVRLYDPVDTRIGGKTRPKTEREGVSWLRQAVAAIDTVPALGGRALAIPLGVPWLVNRVLDGLSSGTLLIVGWEGPADVVDAVVPHGREILAVHGQDLGQEPGWRWFDSRHAVSYKLMPVFSHGGFADTMEVACRWGSVEATYDAVRDAVRPHAVVMAHMSHAYPEGGSIYFSFAGRGDADVYERVWSAALDAVGRSGATITHHHGVGRLKAAAATREVGPAVRGWRELKAELDPAGVMNDGVVFTNEPPHHAPPLKEPAPGDGLGLHPLGCPWQDRVVEGTEPMWPWERLPPPPRWQRSRWQVGWTEVAATIDGTHCLLGRGPRSAAGPDLRDWVVQTEPEAMVTTPVVPTGERWLGRGRPQRPWAVAQQLLRADLRPAVLDACEGELFVGFRGPAARALGALASLQVGGLTEIEWELRPLPSGPLRACDIDDPATVLVTVHGAWRSA
ncbi:MAG: alkyldihydroxyacetonephosphate synthase [Myxococcota bacterium]|jgi:alkyldihydroxyacetonephosphate synthase